MPFYEFDCPGCGAKDVVRRPMKDCGDGLDCSICHEPMQRSYGGCQINTFNPYVEEHVTGTPTLLESRAQRDRFLADHGATYDKGRYSRPKLPSAADAVTPELIHKCVEYERARAAGADIPPTADFSDFVASRAGRTRVVDGDAASVAPGGGS